MKAFIDANILMYASGAPHPYKASSLQLLERIADNTIESVSDVEVLQELLYRYWAVRQADQGLALCDQAMRLIPTILPVELPDVVVAKRLFAAYRMIEPRDAIHAAVMLNHGVTHLYSYDRHFDRIPGLTRFEP